MFIWTFFITKTQEITSCSYTLKSWNNLYLMRAILLCYINLIDLIDWILHYYFRKFFSIFRRIFLLFKHYATLEDYSADRKGQLFRNLAFYMVWSPGGLELESTVKQYCVLVNWKTCVSNTAKESQFCIYLQICSLSFLVRRNKIRTV
jgi:hypothetical protein